MAGFRRDSHIRMSMVGRSSGPQSQQQVFLASEM